MSTAEHNTRLAKLQQELDKFNEDRQGNKRLEQREKKKIEQPLPVTVGQTHFWRGVVALRGFLDLKDHNVEKTLLDASNEVNYDSLSRHK